MMEWISFKNQLPPQDGTHFLGYDPRPSYDERAKIYVLKYDHMTKYFDPGYREASGSFCYEWNPTHWMPLPNPPEEK
jgi:hypothetical protein